MTKIKMIDISKHNGSINWSKVKADGIKFVMIRAGFGWVFKRDPYLDEFVKGCEANNLNYGFYLYSYATNMEQAQTEVKGFLAEIKKYKPTLPIVIDTEDADSWRKNNGNPSLALIADMAIMQMKEIEKAGCYAMWYTMLYWAKQMIALRPKLKDYDLWLAHWTTTMGNPGMPVSIWQYTEKGPKYGSGIDTCDMNWVFKDYPAIIKTMNSPIVEPPKPVIPSTTSQEKPIETVKEEPDINYYVRAGIFSSKERASEILAKLKNANIEGFKIIKTAEKPSIEDPEFGFSGNYEVTARISLAIRAEATTDSEIIGQLNRGSIVSVAWINGSWAKLKYRDGYCGVKYLKKS